MLRKTIIGALLLSLVLIMVACAGPASTTPTPNPTPSGPIKATWIEPQVDEDTISIPVSEVEKNWNVDFKVDTQSGNMTFMAYIVDGEIYVRANVCPPCRSIGFSLEEAVLICDRCATTFKAQTGEGIKGACVGFPKASVPYEINGGNIIMKGTDLIAAYQDTIEPGLP
ncbi:MAG: Fe-S-containing protein [Dehalococcoidia bacterium]|nr:Fe-S-containing protein [Dehalococcoidia bacterium]